VPYIYFLYKNSKTVLKIIYMYVYKAKGKVISVTCLRTVILWKIKMVSSSTNTM